MTNKDLKILILGARGLVGSSLVRIFKDADYTNILAPLRDELNLFEQNSVRSYFEKNKPDVVILAAAKVGGIHANNTYRADFIHENILIQANVFDAALKCKTPNFIFLGSSCIYPKLCPQPIKEEYLLTLPLEATNEPYAIAKIAGLKTSENVRLQYGLNWFSLMPTNLYGVNDNFHPENSHVIPGLIARMVEAKKRGDEEFIAWGTGKPMREFLYVDDMARACLFTLEYSLMYPGKIPNFMNVGTGEDVTIHDLVMAIKDVIGFQGKIAFDSTRPDGTPRKLLDVSLIKSLGWNPQVALEDGLRKSFEFFSKNH